MTAAKLRLAQAAMDKPGTNVGELCTELGVTRQALYRHVDPRGALRTRWRKAARARQTRRRPGMVPINAADFDNSPKSPLELTAAFMESWE
jgi:hypothetical protein